VTRGPFNVTTRVGGQVVAWREPVDDPFIRHTVFVGPRDLLRALFRRVLVVEILVDGDREIVDAVLELAGKAKPAVPAACSRGPGSRPMADRR